MDPLRSAVAQPPPLSALGVGLVALDARLRVLLANDTATALLGTGSLAGLDLAEWIVDHLKDDGGGSLALTEVRDSLTSGAGGEFVTARFSSFADRRWLRFTSAPHHMPGQGDRPEDGFAVSIVDVSELVSARIAEQRTRWQLQTVLDTVEEGVVVWTPAEGVVFATPSWHRMLELSEDQLQLLTEDPMDFVHPEDLPELQSQLEQTHPAQDKIHATFRHRTGTGEYRWMDAVIRLVQGGPGEVAEVHVSLRHAGDRVKAEQEAVAVWEVYRLMAEHGSDAVCWTSPTESPRLYVTPSYTALLGREADDPELEDPLALVHPEDRATVVNLIPAMLSGEKVTYEARFRHADGHFLWMDSATRLVPGEGEGGPRLLTTMREVGARIAAQRELRFEAQHDSLTGLPNRKLSLASLTDSVKSGAGIAAMFIDLDAFSAINESLGHQHADRMLVTVAKRLQESVRPEELVGRLGGDEFLVVIDTTDETRVLEVASALQRAISVPITVAGRPHVVTASVGIAIAGGAQPVAGGDAESLVNDADAAMYAAKRLGRGRLVVFDEQMRAARVDRFALEQQLRAALEFGQFQLAAQPIVALESGRTAGHEMLLRWQHPTRGLLSPDEFLSVLEVSGLAIAVGSWVVREASRIWAQGDRDQWVSVNMSASQLGEGLILSAVREAGAAVGLPPERLMIEVTEQTLLHGGPPVTELFALADQGVMLALDDFGTGYSSVTHLRTLPVSWLKLDRSLVADTDQRAARIAETLVSLATSLGIETIGEGVELLSQADDLQQMGCGYVQGYLFGRPELVNLGR